jgi:hypothetical protein
MESMGTESCRIQDKLVTMFTDSTALAMFSVSVNLTRLMTRISQYSLTHISLFYMDIQVMGAAIFVFVPVLLSFETN